MYIVAVVLIRLIAVTEDSLIKPTMNKIDSEY